MMHRRTERQGRRRQVSVFLVAAAVALLVSWGATAQAGEMPSEEPGVVVVTSQPSGAEILVDGRSAGYTPASLRGFAPGEHRVTVKKAGHLDNSRIIQVGDERSTLDVRLTAINGARQVLGQVEDEPVVSPAVITDDEGGGGSKKWVFIGVGAAAVAGGTVLYLATRNSAPTAGSIGVSPTGTGLMAATNFRFTSQGANDPDGDTLTYRWDFGDGGTAQGSTAQHVYDTEGTFNVRVTVSDGKADASTTANVVVRSLTGSWFYTEPGYAPYWNANVNLTQNGAQFSGTWNWTYFSAQSTFNGRVSDVRHIAYTDIWGPAYGDADATIDRIEGIDGDNVAFVMTRQ